VLFTGLLFFVRPGYTLVAMVFVIFSNLGFSASEIFVSSFLPDIAGQENMGRISGYAWSFGYVGGLLSLAICLIILNFYHPESDAVSYLPIRLTNLVTAVFFAVAAIPTFLWVRERKEKKKIPEQENIFSLSFKRLAVTFQNIAQFKELIRFLVSFIFFHSGIAIVIAFAAIYAQKELGFTPALTVLLVIVVNVTASAGAFIFGFIQDKAGAKKGIFITLVIWIVTVVAAFFIRSRELFWIVANLAGIAMGASLTSARALVGMFSPQSKSAEFFGFWGFAQKFSAILGILTFGLMSYLFSSNRLAILLTIFYFAAGFIVLLFVNEEKGRQAAVNYVDKT
jgi:UMF1 family MFS transporter